VAAEISNNSSGSCCWCWCNNNGHDHTLYQSLPYCLQTVWQNSKYLLFCSLPHHAPSWNKKKWM